MSQIVARGVRQNHHYPFPAHEPLSAPSVPPIFDSPTRPRHLLTPIPRPPFTHEHRTRTYRTVFGVVCLYDSFVEMFCDWLPLYYYFKLGMLMYLLVPQLKGVTIVFDNVLDPGVVLVERRLGEDVMPRLCRCVDMRKRGRERERGKDLEGAWRRARQRERGREGVYPLCRVCCGVSGRTGCHCR